MSRRARAVLSNPDIPARTTAGMSTGSIPSSGDLTSYIPIYVPTDVTSVMFELSNSYVSFPTSINYGDLPNIDVAAYASNGSGAPTGSKLAKWTGQTISELADAPWLSPAFDPTSIRGSDGFIMMLVGIPSGSHVGYAPLQGWGQYQTVNQVDPLPGAWAGFAPVVLSARARMHTRRPRFIVHGDSLSVGYSPAFNVGPGASAFYLPGPANDWLVDINGIPGAGLTDWNTPLLRPYWWTGEQLAGSTVVIELGVNDLATTANLAAYQAMVTAHLALLTAAKVRKVILCTLAPGVSWVAYDTLRQSINTWILTVPSGINAVADVSTAVADPGTPSQLLPAYDSGDGDHWNAAGHGAARTPVEAAMTACL